MEPAADCGFRAEFLDRHAVRQTPDEVEGADSPIGILHIAPAGIARTLVDRDYFEIDVVREGPHREGDAGRRTLRHIERDQLRGDGDDITTAVKIDVNFIEPAIHGCPDLGDRGRRTGELPLQQERVHAW